MSDSAAVTGPITSRSTVPVETTITYSGVIQTYTVTVSGNYEISAYGAQGGGTEIGGFVGGLGAEASGVVALTAGTVLEILVGGEGGEALFGGGGGGGSFVVEKQGTADVPLVVGGGGGGGDSESGANGSPGLTSTGGSAGAGGLHGTEEDGFAGGGGGGFAGDGGGGTIRWAGRRQL